MKTKKGGGVILPLYAIRNRRTMNFLPSSPTERGQTYMEPESGCIPRLFKRERDAKLALKYWIGGILQPEYSLEGEYKKLSSIDLGRSRSTDMKVVKLELHESTNNTSR